MEKRSNSTQSLETDDGDEFSDIFEDLQDQLVEKPYDYAEEVMKSIESEYKAPQKALSERDQEKRDLSLKLGELKKKLNQTRNVRNPKKVAINQSLSEKRKGLKADIEKIKDRLHQIELEEKGSGVTSKTLTDATINQVLSDKQK